jgi:pyruvate dehydrogenase E2 component (dihydrolipoamide acetyltransferase)
VPQFKLPDPGEGLVEAEIVTWRVKPGDQVRVNDVVVEVETAKSLVELPIPWAGTVTEILVPEGETVEVGTPIIAVDTGDGDGADPGTPADAAALPASEQAGTGSGAEPKREANLVGYGPSEGATSRRPRRRSAEAPGQAAAGAQAAVGQTGGPPAGNDPADDPPSETQSDRAPRSEAPPQPDGARQGGPAATDPEQTDARRPLAKPPVRKYAKDQGVDLSAVTPTREDGVITRADVDALRSGAADTPGVAAQTVPEASGGESGGSAPRPTAYSQPAFDRTGERETRTPVKGVRRMTAQAMVASAFTAPHVTEFITVDVTATMELVERLRTDLEFRDIKVSPLLILVKALVLAVRRNPGMVAVWDEDAQEIVQRNYVNLGIAAATPRGLIVPNIKDADLMDLRQLAEAMADLVTTARAGRTQPAQMSGGTITITNVGVFGVDSGTPIINPGESAIVCFGAVRKQPWVVADAAGADQIVPRWITQLAVSFDHRLIDGAMGSQFLADLAAVLEDPTRALVWG